MFRILSLDGGGIRGAFGVGLLVGFEERLGRPVADYFDLLAGTSTGAITAACLCAGKSALEVKAFYDDNAELIFKPRPPHRPTAWLRPIWPIISKLFHARTGGNFDDLFRARYCPMALEAAFEKGFGDLMMADLDVARLIVPSVNLTQGKTVVFRTSHLPEMSDKGDVSIVDVLLAATAAPTYFPHHTLPDGDAYCDGGLWAVSPSLIALAEAVKVCESLGQSTEHSLNVFKNLSLLSVGAGSPLYSLTPPGADAGALYWSRKVADVMGASQVQGVQHPLDFTLGERHHSVNFEIPHREWSLDGIAHREVMFGLGQLRAQEVFDDVAEEFFREPAKKFAAFRSDEATQRIALRIPRK